MHFDVFNLEGRSGGVFAVGGALNLELLDQGRDLVVGLDEALARSSIHG